MKLNTKKLIAREFLLLLICFGVGIIIFISTFVYNSFKENKLIKLQNEINLNGKSNEKLDHSYDKKFETRAWFYNKINEKFDLTNSEYNNPEKLWKRFNDLIQKDSLRYKYEHNSNFKESFKVAGLTNVESVEKFIKTNNLTNVEISDIKNFVKNRKLVNSLKSKTKNIKTSILSYNEKIKLTLWTTFFIFLLIFPLRYLYYSIKWSLTILKQQ